MLKEVFQIDKIKFYAYWKKNDGSFESIDAFKALKLKKNAVIETSPEENAVLFDLSTDLKVFPTLGRMVDGELKQPYFKFYANSQVANSNDTYAYTPEMCVFLRAFEKIRIFTISEDNNKEIVIKPNERFKLQRIMVEGNVYYVDIFMNLKETKPYSYFYKWSGKLALKFAVTNSVKPAKHKALSESGLALFEARARFPRWTTSPDNFKTESDLIELSKSVLNTYENTKYKLLGKFNWEVTTLPEFEEMYMNMLDYEKQCDEMEEQIKELVLDIGEKNKCIEELSMDQQKIQEEIKEEKEILEAYKRENEYYRRLEKDNESLTAEKETFILEKETLILEKERLKGGKESLIAEKKKIVYENDKLKEEITQKDRTIMIAVVVVIIIAIISILQIFI